MRAVLTAILAYLGAGVLPCAAVEATDTGNYMLPHCRAAVGPVEDFLAGVCFGTVNAVAILSSELPPSKSFCLPKVPRDQVVRVVVRYMETHPETLHYGFVGLTIRALHEAWPCKQ
jgi:hypothetical protein